MSKISVVLLMSFMVLVTACGGKNDLDIPQDNVDANATDLTADLGADEVAEPALVYEPATNTFVAQTAETPAPEDAVIVDPLALVSVKETIDMTLKRHHGLKLILAQRETARFDLRGAKAGFGPRLDIIADYGYEQADGDTFKNNNISAETEPVGSVRLVLTQPLWDGFATTSRVKSGIATVDSMTARVFDNATTFTLDAIIAHIDVTRRRMIVMLAQNNVNTHSEILASQRRRVANGVAPASDVTQTQGRLLRAQATLSQNVELLKAAEAQYYRLTGIVAPVNLEDVLLPENIYEDAATAYSQATLTNPKIQAFCMMLM